MSWRQHVKLIWALRHVHDRVWLEMEIMEMGAIISRVTWIIYALCLVIDCLEIMAFVSVCNLLWYTIYKSDWQCCIYEIKTFISLAIVYFPRRTRVVLLCICVTQPQQVNCLIGGSVFFKALICGKCILGSVSQWLPKIHCKFYENMYFKIFKFKDCITMKCCICTGRTPVDVIFMLITCATCK